MNKIHMIILAFLIFSTSSIMAEEKMDIQTAIQIVQKAKEVLRTNTNPVNIGSRNIDAKSFLDDVATAKKILLQNDVALSNNKCCKSGAGPNGGDACYNWDDKFCSAPYEHCSAASDSCPDEVSPSKRVPCNP